MFAFMGRNIMFWNCNCIRPKRKELELYLKENNSTHSRLNPSLDGVRDTPIIDGVGKKDPQFDSAISSLTPMQLGRNRV